jgi:hypothetical protein
MAENNQTATTSPLCCQPQDLLPFPQESAMNSNRRQELPDFDDPLKVLVMAINCEYKEFMVRPEEDFKIIDEIRQKGF